MHHWKITKVAQLLRSELYPTCIDASFEKDVCRELAQIVSRELPTVKEYVRARYAASKRIAAQNKEAGANQEREDGVPECVQKDAG